MFKKVFNIISTIVLIVLIIVVIFIFYTRATGNVPELFGYQIYRVSSGSMAPKLQIGDVILSHKVDPADIHTGDIITYMGTEGDYKDKLITHEVVSEPKYENGHYVIHTQGIVQGAQQDPPISEEQVKGRLVTKLTILNSLYTFFLSPYGLIAFILVIIVLFGFEMISLIVSYRRIDEGTDELLLSDEEKNNKKKK